VFSKCDVKFADAKDPSVVESWSEFINTTRRISSFGSPRYICTALGGSGGGTWDSDTEMQFFIERSAGLFEDVISHNQVGLDSLVSEVDSHICRSQKNGLFANLVFRYLYLLDSYIL
jgi:hypothetical protein